MWALLIFALAILPVPSITHADEVKLHPPMSDGNCPWYSTPPLFTNECTRINDKRKRCTSRNAEGEVFVIGERTLSGIPHGRQSQFDGEGTMLSESILDNNRASVRVVYDRKGKDVICWEKSDLDGEGRTDGILYMKDEKLVRKEISGKNNGPFTDYYNSAGEFLYREVVNYFPPIVDHEKTFRLYSSGEERILRTIDGKSVVAIYQGNKIFNFKRELLGSFEEDWVKFNPTYRFMNIPDQSQDKSKLDEFFPLEKFLPAEALTAQECRDWGCQEVKLNLEVAIVGEDGKNYRLGILNGLKVPPQKIIQIPSVAELLATQPSPITN